MKGARVWALHLALLAVLLVLQWVVPPYHANNLARIMVLALFASGYNLAFGYTGLLSLGHALFLAAGVYAAGLSALHGGLGGGWLLVLGIAGGAALAALVGLLALRTKGVAFMIVTLMFAQAGYLALLYFSRWTGGAEGFTLPAASRTLLGADLSQPGPRYLLAFGVFAVGMLFNLALVRSRAGRVLQALRENEERCRMLGYNPFVGKFVALALSGAYAGAAGASYALLFGYAGASFAGIQYSILPLLYVLAGGAGTVAGPLLGTAGIFYLSDLAADLTSAWVFVVGLALVLIIVFAPQGLLGAVRARLWRDLP